MIEGHDCAGAAHHCGIGNADIGADGYALGEDGRTPVSNLKRLTVNGSPVSEASHEFVMPKRTDTDKL